MKKMWRLSREHIDQIINLSPYMPPVTYRDLKRDNLSLVPSLEEKDEQTMFLYRCVRENYEGEGVEEFVGFQAWIRHGYASKGFVEVDYNYVGEAEARGTQVDRRSTWCGVQSHRCSSFFRRPP